MHSTPTVTTPNRTKKEFYADLLDEVKAFVDGQRFWVTNLANAAALIYHGLHSLEDHKNKRVNWAGFYITDPTNDQKLILGPFQGKVACTEIQFGKGVCGAAAATQQTQVVKNVHEFPSHIACDSASNSEIVVPLVLSSGKLIGVIDIDCEELEGFNDDDRVGLEAVAKVIVDSCDWW
ncbi:GAF domain-like protein [Umbelopsis sp. PMI_123]|nr:GAF domain-like protein [Umbelopsis sp. PMI_123]